MSNRSNKRTTEGACIYCHAMLITATATKNMAAAEALIRYTSLADTTKSFLTFSLQLPLRVSELLSEMIVGNRKATHQTLQIEIRALDVQGR